MKLGNLSDYSFELRDFKDVIIISIFLRGKTITVEELKNDDLGNV